MEIDKVQANQVRISYKKTAFMFYPECDNLPKASEGATVVMVACTSDNITSLVDKNTKLTIDGAGEYEVDDFSIQGTQVDNDTVKTIYRLVTPEGSKVVLLPRIKSEMLTDKVLESIGLVDVLVIPAGDIEGVYTPVETSKLVRTLAPKVVIPLCDQTEIVDNFVKEVGGVVHKDDKVFKSKMLQSLDEGQHIFVLN